MRFALRVPPTAALLVFGLLLTGCGGEPPTSSSTSSGGTPAASSGAPAAPGEVRLTGAGATFPYPLYSKWFDAYHQTNAGVTVNYQSIGSGGGIQQLKARTVDFGASDAPLSNDEAKEMPAPVVHIPTVAGAVVLAYNLPEAPAQLKLTPEAIAGIFLGTIKRWNDPAIASANTGASLPDRAIAVAHRSDGSGTTYIFTHYLEAISPDWKSKVGSGKSVEWPVGIGGKGNEGVTAQVKQTPGAIGYTELAYAKQNGLKYAWVKNAAGEFVEPTVESTTAAASGAEKELAKDVRSPIANSSGKGAYPIAGFTFILAYQEMDKADQGKAVAKLLDWCIHDGQKMTSDLSYAPLPDAVVKLNEKTLSTLKAGGEALSVER